MSKLSEYMQYLRNFSGSIQKNIVNEFNKISEYDRHKLYFNDNYSYATIFTTMYHARNLDFYKAMIAYVYEDYSYLFMKLKYAQSLMFREIKDINQFKTISEDLYNRSMDILSDTSKFTILRVLVDDIEYFINKHTYLYMLTYYMTGSITDALLFLEDSCSVMIR